MSDIISPTVDSDSKLGSDLTSRIAEVKEWLGSEFSRAGKEVPDFEYTPFSVSHLHNLCTLSQAKTRAAEILAKDFRLKAAEYRAQGKTLISELSIVEICNGIYFLLIDLFSGALAARIREILESVGMAQENLPSNVVSSAQVLANVASLLNIRDTELSR